MEVRQVGGEHAFDGFVVAEHPVELLRQRQRPVAGVRNQLEQRPGFRADFERVLALRDRRHRRGDPLHLAEQLVDAPRASGKRAASARRAASKLSGIKKGWPSGPPRAW